jgi:hypothetical protein
LRVAIATSSALAAGTILARASLAAAPPSASASPFLGETENGIGAKRWGEGGKASSDKDQELAERQRSHR